MFPHKTLPAFIALLVLMSCSDSLVPSEPNLIPEVPQLQFPKDNAELEYRNPLFSWSVVDDATHYHIRVDNTPDFSSPVVDEYLIGSSSYQTEQFLENEVLYYWHVSAANRYGESHYTPARSFICKPSSQSPPLLIAPEQDSDTVDSTPTFSWEAVPDADLYVLIVDDDSEFSSPVLFETEIEETWFTPEVPLQRNRTYYWKVSTRTNGSWSVWSDRWNFDLLTDPNGFYYGFDGTMNWTWDEPEICELPNEGRAYFNTQKSTGYSTAYTAWSHSLAIGDIFEVEIDEEGMSDIDGDQRIMVGFISNLFDEYIGELENGIFVSYQSYWLIPVLKVFFCQDGTLFQHIPRMLLGIGTYRVRVEILGAHSYELTLWRNGVFYSQDVIQVDVIDLTQIETNYAVIRNARNYSGSIWRGRYEGYVNELSLGQ